ncbi:MAG: DUF5935 domain-containing protein [Rhodospirillales bacterium]
MQIEAFLLVYIFSLMGELLPFAGKTLLTGGRYGTSFGLIAGNTGFVEGSHLTTVAMLIVPFAADAAALWRDPAAHAVFSA